MIDPKLCPLCGEPNACARAEDPESNHCWCSSERFPSSLLERVPAVAVRKACICRDCVRQAARTD